VAPNDLAAAPKAPQNGLKLDDRMSDAGPTGQVGRQLRPAKAAAIGELAYGTSNHLLQGVVFPIGHRLGLPRQSCSIHRRTSPYSRPWRWATQQHPSNSIR